MWTFNPPLAGSSPAGATILEDCVQVPHALVLRTIEFLSGDWLYKCLSDSAFEQEDRAALLKEYNALEAQVDVRVPGKDEAAGSTPASGSTFAGWENGDETYGDMPS